MITPSICNIIIKFNLIAQSAEHPSDRKHQLLKLANSDI